MILNQEDIIANREGPQIYNQVNSIVNYLRKIISNDDKRREEIVYSEKKLIKRIDEIKKHMGSNQLDINDDKKPITTDHFGHPLLVKKPEPKKLP